MRWSQKPESSGNAQRCCKSQSRQLKNKGENVFSALHGLDQHYTPYALPLAVWPYYTKIAGTGPELLLQPGHLMDFECYFGVRGQSINKLSGETGLATKFS